MRLRTLIGVAVCLGMLGSLARAAADAVARCLAGLESRDRNLRFKALDTVEELGASAKAVVPALVKILRGYDGDLQIRTLRALRGLGELARPAIPDIVRLVDSQDLEVSCAALLALRHLGPAAKDAIPFLISSLRERKPSVTEYGHQFIWCLREIDEKNPKVRAALARCLEHENALIRVMSVEYFLESKEPDARLRGVLIDALATKDTQAQVLAAWLLGRHGSSSGPEVSSLVRLL
jgi:hypothetical protein